MGKFVYLSYIQWNPGGSWELYNKKIKPKLSSDKVELLHDGPVYGVIEDSIMIHRTDLDIDAFTTFRAEACTVDGENSIAHARTITSTPGR